MIQVTPQMRILVAVEPVDFRKGITGLEHFPFSYTGSAALRDTSNGEKPRGLKPAARNTETGNALARLCKEELKRDPFCGWVFVFRNRRATAVKVLAYDSQGFWLSHKRLSRGRFRWWPTNRTGVAKTLKAHQLQVLLSAGNPEAAQAAPSWRPVGPAD